MTYQGAHRLRPGNRPLPTPAPGPGVDIYGARRYHAKEAGGWIAWNGLGAIIGLCATCDQGVDFGALLIFACCASAVALVVGSFMWVDSDDPPSESGGPG